MRYPLHFHPVKDASNEERVPDGTDKQRDLSAAAVIRLAVLIELLVTRFGLCNVAKPWLRD